MSKPLLALLFITSGVMAGAYTTVADAKSKDFTATVLANGDKIPKAVQIGATLYLADLLKDKQVRGAVLNFVDTQSPFCKEQLPAVAKAFRTDKDSKSKVIVATVFIDRNKQAILKTVKQNNLPMLVLWDKERSGVKAYKVMATPTVIALNKDGKVIGIYEGMFLPTTDGYSNFFKVIVQAVVKGTAPPQRPMMSAMMGRG